MTLYLEYFDWVIMWENDANVEKRFYNNHLEQ